VCAFLCVYVCVYVCVCVRVWELVGMFHGHSFFCLHIAG